MKSACFNIMSVMSVIGLVACNGSKKADSGGVGPSPTDILFVVDSSSSMSQNIGSFGVHAEALFQRLYRSPPVDYRIGITTATPDDLVSDGLDPGEAGLLIDTPIGTEHALPSQALREQLWCRTAHWPSDTPIGQSDENCSEAPEGDVTQGHLDCLCGLDEWKYTREGTGSEEHLESALMTLCRSVPNPPQTCYDSLSIFKDTADKTNSGFIRPDSTVIVVLLTDEGDSSRRIPSTGADVDLATQYVDAFAEFDNTIRVMGIGPLYDPAVDEQPRCTDGAALGGYLVDRIIHATEETGGQYRSIVDESSSGSCEMADFIEHFEVLSDLIRGLST